MTATVFLTGGAGSVGRCVTRALAENGFRVRALVHRHDVDYADEQVYGSILDVDVLRDAIRGCVGVVHLAALTHARSAAAYRLVNVEGTRAAVTAAEDEPGVRFVFVSSRAATRQGGAYSVSKLDSEEVVRGSSLDWTIVRLPEVYGTQGAEGVDRILGSARAGKHIFVPSADAEVCPMHIDDAVAACLGALTSAVAVGRTYTLAGECISIRHFAEMCQARSGESRRIVSVPLWIVRVAAFLSRGLPLPIYPDQLARLMTAKPPASTGAADELGFIPRPLKSGIDSVFQRP